MILVKDVEDRAALIEREARERVSGVEAESTAMLASAHEEAEGLV
jgi:tetrahydromethanopterin S-methyltransferase subunit F